MKSSLRTIASLAFAVLAAAARGDERTALSVPAGLDSAEVRETFTAAQGLPSDDILSLAVAADGTIAAGTPEGLALFDGARWRVVDGVPGPVTRVAARGPASVLAAAGTRLFEVASSGEGPVAIAEFPEGLRGADALRDLAGTPRILAAGSAGLFERHEGHWRAIPILDKTRDIAGIDTAPDGRLAVAARDGLFVADVDGNWTPLVPKTDRQAWAPIDVAGVAFDTDGRLWFAGLQGVGVWDGTAWKLFTGDEGLPYDGFTAIGRGEPGAVWFGTRIGAIRYADGRWEYRMAPRWLPDDGVRDMAIAADGTAWFATRRGVGKIARIPMTLREKARRFEADIDRRHRRTPYGYVDSAHLPAPGDRSAWTGRDSDNDGLWTSMYGAGECFAYAATKDPDAKRRATAAFEAVRFLSEVTRGGSHPLQGFPARSILPTSGPDPNQNDSAERDRRHQERDPLWKIIAPRWPTSADGKWYWKCDTSSDELDGHFFLYAAYYDLVAETDEEKQRARDVTTAIVDHLMRNNYALVDHDGKPTRWARFGPDVLNGGILFEERGLNSLSILSYLKVAEHMTGDARYADAYRELVTTHSYAVNTLHPKMCMGPGTGNQSDDEMAFMCYYNLLNYERDPPLRETYLASLRWYWTLERDERNPLFHFIYCARDAADPSSADRLVRQRQAIEDSIDALRRIPIDRVRWGYRNSHRLDIVRMEGYEDDRRAVGRLRDGKVIPVDERDLEHWNQDPWVLDEASDGRTLTDGAAFLLPYYLGLHHRFLVE